VYGQAPRIPFENPQPKQLLPQAPQQYYPQQQQQQMLVASSVNLPQVEMLQPQSSMLIPRLGRASRGMSLPRADDEDVEEYAEEDLSHAPSKKKKKNKKKASDSFPRRIIKKTTNAIRNTAGAVFGAPKYIYTRYRDTYLGGSKKSQKKKSKGKVKYQDEDEDKNGWGWESQYEGHNNNNGHEAAVIDHHHYPIDNQGYGYARNTNAGTDADEYERKSSPGGRNLNNNLNNQYNNDYNEYKYKRYLYAQPSQMVQNDLEEQGRGNMEAKQNKPGRLASLKAWFTQG